MSRELHIDFESRSAVDLKKTGVHVYAEGASTDLWCAAYAFDDEPVKLWTPSVDIHGDAWDFPAAPIPDEIAKHVRDGGVLYAHNAAFERTIWHHILAKRYRWPEPDVTQWRCTMAMALAMALPGSLENAAAAVGLQTQKDMKGHALMLRMAKPRKRTPEGEFVWWDMAERKERLYAYCIQDVEVERELHQRLLPLSEVEQRLWHIDQRINDRGVHVDEKFCQAATRIVEQTIARLNAEMLVVTDYEVGGVTKVKELTEYVVKAGIPTDGIAKGDVVELLGRGDLPAGVRRALEIRQEGGKSSVSKIDALLRGRSRDGRARGLLQYHAASTGRWAGRRFQPQNLKRPDETTDVPAAIAAIMAGRTSRTIEWAFGPPLSIVGDCIRGMVVAAPGRKFYVADFVSIEGVVLPWLAGEDWKLEAFRDYRAGNAPDLYIQSYCKTFGVPLFDKKDPRRQVGKVMELASGFQGGHGAYLRMGASGQKLVELTRMIREATHPAEWDRQSLKYETGANGLPEDQWTTLRIVIDSWRGAHPAIVQFWWDLEKAAIEAVRYPGRAVPVADGKIIFKKSGSFLWCRLPSGRALCYPYPRVEARMMPWGAEKFALVCKGVDAYTRKWGDCWLYGGLLAENVTQAAARDLLREAILRCEAAGYGTVLHCHDENVAETDEGFGSLSEFERLMEVVPAWATGCPIAADGWEGTRYRK